MKRIIALTGLLLMFGVLSACGETPQTPTIDTANVVPVSELHDKDIIGIWNNPNPPFKTTIEFAADGTFTYANSIPDLKTGDFIDWGTFTTEGGNLILNSEDTSMACPGHQGIYGVGFADPTVILFQLVEDVCPDRRAEMGIASGYFLVED